MLIGRRDLVRDNSGAGRVGARGVRVRGIAHGRIFLDNLCTPVLAAPAITEGTADY